MEHNITIVGLDAHKNSIEIVTAETAGNQEVRHYGKVGGDMTSLDKASRKLRNVRSKGAELRFVYEAGPCGYEIYRHLTKQGFQCVVVAPSLIPKKSGARIKNDRRDAEKTIDFYVNILSFRIRSRNEVRMPPMREVIYLELGDTVIEIISADDPKPKSEASWEVGYRGIALEVEDMAEAVDYLKG